MAFDPLSSAFELGKTAIERIWPDANERAKQMVALEELRQKGDLAELNAHVQLMLAQIEVNKVEAAHPSLFVAGGRPAIIWIGTASLAYTFIVHDLILWVFIILKAAGKLSDAVPPPPLPDASQLFMLIGSLLGVSAMRSFDKREGTATTDIKKKSDT